jgi:hypothetical protein
MRSTVFRISRVFDLGLLRVRIVRLPAVGHNEFATKESPSGDQAVVFAKPREPVPARIVGVSDRAQGTSLRYYRLETGGLRAN